MTPVQAFLVDLLKSLCVGGSIVGGVVLLAWFNVMMDVKWMVDDDDKEES